MTNIYNKLQKLLKNSYAPYSNFNVACILIDKNGTEHCGVNVESVAFPSGLCAERNAIFSSVTKGLRPYQYQEMHIISSKNDEVVNCCGGCLQVMNEFLEDSVPIYSYTFDGKKIRKSNIREMMPFPVDSGLLK